MSEFSEMNFHELLDYAIDKRAKNTYTTKGNLYKEYAKTINKAGHEISAAVIRNWSRSGHGLPSENIMRDAVEAFADDCIEDEDLGKEWVRAFIFRARVRLSREDENDLYNKYQCLCIGHDWDRFFQKLETVREAPPLFIIVTGIYLDLIVSPIDKITPDGFLPPGLELTGIDPISLELGGSGILLGRHLNEFGGYESYVFSILANPDDTFQYVVDKFLQQEIVLDPVKEEENPTSRSVNLGKPRWIHNCVSRGSRLSRTPTTIQMVRTDGVSKTMITNRGVLRELDWGVLDDAGIEELQQQIGVFCISSFIKTSLDEQLLTRLGEISKNQLVVVDHGSITPGRGQSMVAILKTVFQRRHADVLFSTMRELFFYHKDAENVTYEKPESEEETLEKIRAIAEREDLPFITVVRDRGLPGSTKVFLIYDRVVFPLNVPSGNLPRRNNVFNAAFLSELVSKDTDMVNRSKFLKEVANNALKLWIQDNS